MADTVLYEVSDGLATITLNRPEAMNALNVATKVALRDAVGSAADDSAVRAVLLTAAGDRSFCVGQDLKEHIGLLLTDRETGSRQTMSTVREHYNPITRALTEMRKPVVAGVNGVAAGAGFCCDDEVLSPGRVGAPPLGSCVVHGRRFISCFLGQFALGCIHRRFIIVQVATGQFQQRLPWPDAELLKQHHIGSALGKGENRGGVRARDDVTC